MGSSVNGATNESIVSRGYAKTNLGAAESSFELEQGVLEKRIPSGICFQAERSSDSKEPQLQGVITEIACSCVRFGENRPRAYP